MLEPVVLGVRQKLIFAIKIIDFLLLCVQCFQRHFFRMFIFDDTQLRLLIAD